MFTDIRLGFSMNLEGNPVSWKGKSIQFVSMIRTTFLLLITSIFVSSPQAQSDEVRTTHEALVAFYNSTNGDRWRRNPEGLPYELPPHGWDIHTVPSSMEEFNQWHGLTVSDGKLISLELVRYFLFGSIPPDIGNLINLKHLELSNIHHNVGYRLSGSIPPEIGNLTKLEHLNLAGEFTGWIPPELANLIKLDTLILKGVVSPIPPFLGKFDNLKKLELSGEFNSEFGDKIPSELGNLKNLETLVLGNLLSRESGWDRIKFGMELANLTNLRKLIITGDFTGEIPSELGNLTKLEHLELNSENYHRGMNVTGAIPRELGNLTNLKKLIINSSDNRFNSEIPSELGNLAKLVHLELSGSLTGAIPRELGNLAKLVHLSLGSSSLTGEIPSELGNLAELEHLSLGSRWAASPVGAIPRSFLQLKKLETLELSESVCVPRIYEFVARLIRRFPNLDNRSICEGAFFYQDNIANQSYIKSQQISQITLPEATSQLPSIATNYTLTPTLPQGLKFDPSTRSINGIPTESSSAKMYSYKSHDSNNFRDSLHFSIEVNQPVSTELDELPDDFTIHSNYPNPFHNSTSLVFDLPYPAQVGIELLDVMGRQVFTKPPEHFSAGRGIQVDIDGSNLPSGIYLYRLTATTSEGDFSHMGQLVKIR